MISTITTIAVILAACYMIIVFAWKDSIKPPDDDTFYDS